MEFWTAPKMWKDGECWIIGGGSSMPRMFGVPETVIQDVQAKRVPFSIYSDYLSPLHNRNVIATNIAFMLGSWVSALYFCDKQFWMTNRIEVRDYHGLKITDTNALNPRFTVEYVNIKKMKRDNSAGICTEPDMIRWNRNAGGGAINVAYHFGVKRILLLGYDMGPGSDGKTHWHSGHPSYKHPTPERTFARFLKMYPYIKRDADALGIEILNVNDNSRLDVFPKVKLEEVL